MLIGPDAEDVAEPEVMKTYPPDPAAPGYVEEPADSTAAPPVSVLVEPPTKDAVPGVAPFAKPGATSTEPAEPLVTAPVRSTTAPLPLALLTA